MSSPFARRAMLRTRVWGCFALSLLPIVVSAGPAIAQGQATATMQVSLTVQATCSLSANDLTFGTVQGDATSAEAQADLTANCSSSLSYRISIDAGQNLANGTRGMVDASANAIAYTLYQDAARSVEWGDADLAATYANGNAKPDTGAGADQTHTVYATATDINGRPGGSYTDSVTVTVTF